MYRPYALPLIVIAAILILSGAPQPKGSPPAQVETGGTLILNEISPWPSDGIVWIELYNPTEGFTELNGWSIEFLSGDTFIFPAQPPMCPPGFVILIEFGVEPVPPSREEGIIRIQSAASLNLNPEGDGCILNSPEGPVDAITWGHPEIPSDLPLNPGHSLRPPYGYKPDDEILISQDDVLIRIPGTWSEDGTPFVGSQNWEYRRGDQASLADPSNPIGPWLMRPEDGARFASDFALAVQGYEWADGVEYQVATDEGFSNVVVEETSGHSLALTDLAPGTYYWRVRSVSSDGETGSWSNARTFTRAAFDLDELTGISNSNVNPENNHLAQAKAGGEPSMITEFEVIGLGHICQWKDTELVCLDGCHMYGNYFWDNSHPYGIMEGGHNADYCVRASLAMVAGLFGNTLSQDRISYYIFEELGSASRDAVDTGHIGDPFHDLGHGEGTFRSSTCLALDWIYDEPRGSSFIVDCEWENFRNDTPGRDSVVEVIDTGNPVIFLNDGHAVVVDGYALTEEEDGTESAWMHILDPWDPFPEGANWEEFTPTSGWNFILPPMLAIPVREDEPGVRWDTDHDGLMDFDEEMRFHTDPNDADTDGDGLDDKTDMLEYLFDRDGTYSYHPSNRDVDNDGVPKELDPDNDRSENDGMPDGCEDANASGFYDPEGHETSNFLPDDDYDWINPECLRGILRVDYSLEIDASGQVMDKVWYEQIRMEPDNFGSTEYVHEHTWARSMEILGPMMVGGGEDSGSGFAKVTLVENELTGEFTVTTDVNTVWRAFEWTASPTPGLPMPPGSPIVFQHITPTRFAFADNVTYPLGTPVEMNGGLVLEGEGDIIYELTGTTIPGVSCTLTWEIWVVPPTD